MELDLNNVAEVAPETKPPAAMATSDSGSSESSVLNAEAASGGAAAPTEEGSSSTPPPPAVLEFSILRSESDAAAAGAEDDDDATPSPPRHHHHHHQQHPQLITREFFPNAGGPPRPPPQHWADMGFFRPEPPRHQQPDIRILPHPHATAPAVAPPPVQPPAAKKSRRGPRSRSSQYRGVTFYRRTGRWESHIWAYDRAAIKFRGVDADINFNLSDYEDDMKQAAIKCNGREAVTNFEPSTYDGELMTEVGTEVADVDLNLSISQPASQSPKRDKNSLGLQLHHGSFDGSELKRTKIDTPSELVGHPHRFPLMTEHPPIWPAQSHPFFTNNESASRDINRRPSEVGTGGVPSWAWKVTAPPPPTQLPLPLFSSSSSSAAASSGFSHTVTTAAPATPSASLRFDPASSSSHHHR
nr:unnamed protein product [Digitaria exilis]